MQDLDHNEDRLRGTYEFPFEFHHIDQSHPRYVMSYHWHVEYEIIRILEGYSHCHFRRKKFHCNCQEMSFLYIVEYFTVGIPDELCLSVHCFRRKCFPQK